MASLTLFEKIILGEIPAKKVYEDEWALAFYDINPQAPVHVLVIPKKKARNFSELSAWSHEEVAHYMNAIQKTIEILAIKEKGYRLVFNTGDFGGQSVDYLHAHILGGRSLSWPPG